MHLDGYGCAGTNAVSYGLACLEMEAVDSGLRSLVSVQGSLAMFAIHAYGSDEHKDEWLPGMATGAQIGCFGLTEPDFGSNPAGMRTVARRDGDDWVLNGTKLWITNGSIADVAVVWARTDDRIRGFVVPTETKGFSANEIHQKLSLRASVTSELVLEDVCLPGRAVLPGVAGLAGPLGCLNEARFGIIFGALGAARDSLAVATDYATTRKVFDKPLAAYQLDELRTSPEDDPRTNYQDDPRIDSQDDLISSLQARRARGWDASGRDLLPGHAIPAPHPAVPRTPIRSQATARRRRTTSISGAPDVSLIPNVSSLSNPG